MSRIVGLLWMIVAGALLGGCEGCAPSADPLDPCEGVTCSGHGSCVAGEVAASCDCHEGYHPDGLACVDNDPDDPCEGVLCSGHGACRVEEGAPWCDCDPGYERGDSGATCDRTMERPVDLAPGESLLVDVELGSRLSDLHRSDGGTFIVASFGASGVGEIELARSTDRGESWSVTQLGNAGGQPTYSGRVFAIDEALLGVTASQGSDYPYDGFLQTSGDDGESWSGEWVNFSLSPDRRGERMGMVVETPLGQYVAVFSNDGIFYRRSPSLEGWEETERQDLANDESRSTVVSVTTAGTDLLVSAPDQGRVWKLYRSEDDGESFRLLTEVDVEQDVGVVELHYSEADQGLYACAVARGEGAESSRVYTFASADLGESFDEGRLHLDGLPPGAMVACHVDDTGVYVAYDDPATGETFIVLPGALGRCGNDLRELAEACDGSDLHDQSCLGHGYGSGELSCSDSCDLDFSECVEAEVPISCAHVSASADGVYEVDPDGHGPRPPFEVYCAEMDSFEPIPYLQLPAAGPTTNYSHYEYTAPEMVADCWFSAIRIEDLPSMRIDTGDQRFATCEGHPEWIQHAAWGRASSCRGPETIHGFMNLDLTGTPFALDYAGGMEWQVVGWLPAGSVTLDDPPGRIVEAEGGGDCGGVAPVNPPGMILTFWGEG